MSNFVDRKRFARITNVCFVLITIRNAMVRNLPSRSKKIIVRNTFRAENRRTRNPRRCRDAAEKNLLRLGRYQTTFEFQWSDGCISLYVSRTVGFSSDGERQGERWDWEDDTWSIVIYQRLEIERLRMLSSSNRHQLFLNTSWISSCLGFDWKNDSLNIYIYVWRLHNMLVKRRWW